MKDKILGILIFILSNVFIATIVIIMLSAVISVAKNPEVIIPIGLLLLGVLTYFGIKKHTKYSRKNKLNELISWCVSDDSRIYRNNLRLEDYVINAQIKLNLPKEFRIDIHSDEYEYAKTILKNFQNDTAKKYFNDSSLFTLPESKHRLDGETYFVYLLHSYLYEHQCDYMFCENKMHKNIISRKEYEGDGSNTTYELTDFAVVFQKLLYISYMYCKNSPVINQIKPYYSQETIQKSIEKTISSKSISISRYRP